MGFLTTEQKSPLDNFSYAKGREVCSSWAPIERQIVAVVDMVTTEHPWHDLSSGGQVVTPVSLSSSSCKSHKETDHIHV